MGAFIPLSQNSFVQSRQGRVCGDDKWILSFPNPRSVLNPRGASRLPVGLPELDIEFPCPPIPVWAKKKPRSVTRSVHRGGVKGKARRGYSFLASQSRERVWPSRSVSTLPLMVLPLTLPLYFAVNLLP